MIQDFGVDSEEVEAHLVSVVATAAKTDPDAKAWLASRNPKGKAWLETHTVVDQDLGLAFSADELAALVDADSAMGFVPDIGDTDFEAGASVDLNPADRPSMFASITDEEIF